QSARFSVFVTKPAAECSGKDVHQSKGKDKVSGSDPTQSEGVLEVVVHRAVHGEFDTKAGGVYNEKHPNAVVFGSLQEADSIFFAFWDFFSTGDQFRIVASWSVFGEKVVEQTGQKTNNPDQHH